MGPCRTCGGEYVMVSCPDFRPGCLVAHYACPKCFAMRAKEREEAETLRALQEANGIEPGPRSPT